MSTVKYHFIGLIVFLCVAISAILSASYGYELGEGHDAYIFAATFALFDIVIAILAAEASNKWVTKYSARLLFIGLIGLSVISGAAFMVGKQSQGQGFRIEALKLEIRTLDMQISRLDPIKRPANLREAREARELAFQRLQELIEEQGGEITKGNAFFVYVSKEVGVNPDVLSAALRVIAMLSLNLSGIILAAWRNQRTENNESSRSSLRLVGNSDELNKVKRSILQRKTRPSVSHVAKMHTRNNRAKAEQYLKQLEEMGIIEYNGHGKKRKVIV